MKMTISTWLLFQSFLDVEHMEKLMRKLSGKAGMQLKVGLTQVESWGYLFPHLE